MLGCLLVLANTLRNRRVSILAISVVEWRPDAQPFRTNPGWTRDGDEPIPQVQERSLHYTIWAGNGSPPAYVICP